MLLFRPSPLNQMTTSKFLFLTLLFILIVPASAEETWEPPYVGSDPEVLYLPDAHAVYWRYGWKRKPGDSVGLKIEGQFPEARYFSYNAYNDGDKMSVGSFADFELIPNDGAVNPFAGAVDAGDSTYTIYILPEGAEGDSGNTLHFPDSLTNVSVILRHYLSEGDRLGGAPMPTVSLFDLETQVTETAPPSVPVPKLTREEVKQYLLPLFKDMAEKFEANPEEVIKSLHHRVDGDSLKINELVCKQVVANAFNFYRKGEVIQSYNFQTEGTYPNKDNLYLVLPVIRESDEVLLVQFQAPPFPKSPQEYPTSGLRYFSLSQGDEITHNFATMIDKDMNVSDDGIIRFLIGDESDALKATAEKIGANFMPWKVHQKMLLVYRHMLPGNGFTNGIDQVPSVDKQKSPEGQEGSAFIGKFAPTGKLISSDEAAALTGFPAF